MTPIFLSFVSFSIVTLISQSILFFNRRQKDKKENLFVRLSKEGSENNLVFCSQEILCNKVIGIDGIHRKIMILEKINHAYKSSVISLDEMQKCELKSSYGSLERDNVERSEIEKKLTKIELQFNFKDNCLPATITFYDNVVNSKKEIILLKAKAEYWSVMLSKMLLRPVEARA